MSALYEFLSELTHAPNVVYVVDWTIQTGVSDVGLKNEQTLIIFKCFYPISDVLRPSHRKEYARLKYRGCVSCKK